MEKDVLKDLHILSNIFENLGYTKEAQVVNEVLEYKTNGTIPDHIKGKKRYQEKWKPFYVKDNRLIYRPLELIVIIDPEEKNEVMQKIMCFCNSFVYP